MKIPTCCRFNRYYPKNSCFWLFLVFHLPWLVLIFFKSLMLLSFFTTFAAMNIRAVIHRIPLWAWIVAMLAVAASVLIVGCRKASRTASIALSDVSAGVSTYGGKAVDLGIGVKWAVSNLGSDSPQGYGFYYTGSTRVKNDFPSAVSRNPKKLLVSLFSDMKSAGYGSQWRLPSVEEAYALEHECSWQWVSLGGIEGCKVTGPNGNSIFLPANCFDDSSSSRAQWKFGNYHVSNSNSVIHSDNLMFFDFSDRHLSSYCIGSVRLVIP